MDIRSKRKRRERGSTLVEFSLTILPLLGLLMLMLDVTWVIFAWASVQEGAREGARVAITGQSDDAIRIVVRKYSFGFVKAPPPRTQDPIQIYYYSPSNLSATQSGTGATCSGEIVKVVVSGIPITPMAPIWRSNSPLALSAAAADIVEPNSTCR